MGVDSAYWGRIIASMTLMAAGLALASTPATDAIMGASCPGRPGPDRP
jgi:MFS transporter, DHA2 family, multidrug resistance protein